MEYGVVDVHYPDTGGARAALVVAADCRFARIVAEYVGYLPVAAPYRPGHFYERELAPVRAVLAAHNRLDLLVVDGYVDLEPSGRPGLGGHLYAETAIPVIGVAKTAFRSATHAIEVRRGAATRPLYVTAAGLPLVDAARLVTTMDGPYRIPNALRRADRLART